MGVVVRVALLIGLLLGLVVAGLIGFGAYQTYEASHQVCGGGAASCDRPGG